VPAKGWKLRAAIASLGVVTGVAVSIGARHVMERLAPRRNRRIATDPGSADLELQRMVRFRTADGDHYIHATLLAEFEPGDRIATLSVAFCPPFERLPAVEVEIEGDSTGTVKLTQILHNGAQLEVRLLQASDESHFVAVELYATDAEIDVAHPSDAPLAV
jgi:hypothetical protein